MTIVTKPISEKKADKLEEPLVCTSVRFEPAPPTSAAAPKSCANIYRQRPAPCRPVINQRERRIISATTFCLFLTTLIVVNCGVFTGFYLYKQFVRAQVQRFQGWCSIPYEEDRYSASLQSQPMSAEMQNRLNEDLALIEKISKNVMVEKPDGRFFNEQFEIDEPYEKITVPEFAGGRRCRFVHDFKTNKTGIIDLDEKRCFVMPLNRTLVLPPDSLRDLIEKMKDGYYDVDLSILREKMRVVLPAIDDRSNLGRYIQKECDTYPIYKLERYVSGVYKRSAEPQVKFIEFAGKNTLELNIVNYAELAEHEIQDPVAMA